VEVLPHRAFRVELPNGHRLFGFGLRRMREAVAALAAGDRVILDLSPCDFSKGRIVQVEKQMLQ
jgi:translation initiation factor IF-1